MAYGKQIIRSVDLKTNSGPVLYTNLLGIVPMILLGMIAGEPAKFRTDRMNGVPVPIIAYFLLLLGCITGTGIGYTSWWCRDKVSAATFSLIGVMNKCLTIVINYMIWDQHAPLAGIACLSLCLVGGAFYQQAPLRSQQLQSNASSKIDLVASTEDVWDSTISGIEINEVDEQPLLVKQRN
jgi:drug/metabolite transporter (DMT)-like permease